MIESMSGIQEKWLPYSLRIIWWLIELVLHHFHLHVKIIICILGTIKAIKEILKVQGDLFYRRTMLYQQTVLAYKTDWTISSYIIRYSLNVQIFFSSNNLITWLWCITLSFKIVYVQFDVLAALNNDLIECKSLRHRLSLLFINVKQRYCVDGQGDR